LMAIGGFEVNLSRIESNQSTHGLK
jgi:hypothetical protein